MRGARLLILFLLAFSLGLQSVSSPELSLVGDDDATEAPPRRRKDDLPQPLPVPGPWYIESQCLGVSAYERNVLFFPETPDVAAAGLKICAACPVREQCREYARTNRIKHGTWGGETEWDRRRGRRRASLRIAREREPRERPTYTGPVETIADAYVCFVCTSSALVVDGGPGSLQCLGCNVRWPKPI